MFLHFTTNIIMHLVHKTAVQIKISYIQHILTTLAEIYSYFFIPTKQLFYLGRCLDYTTYFILAKIGHFDKFQHFS